MLNQIAFVAEMMGYIMYFHWAIHLDDSVQFVDAVVKEENDHVDN